MMPNSEVSKNLSVHSKNSKTSIQLKSLTKTNTKVNSLENSYIAQALANIEKGCIDQRTGQLKIDGNFGDYRMKLFRKKNRQKYFNDPTSIFSDKDFIQKIFDCANSSPNKKENILK